MKNNISEWLFQPFKRIAGMEAFLIGLSVAAIAAIIGSFSGVAFDGIIDAHFDKELTLSSSLLYTAINVVTLVTFMYLAGLLVAKRFRFIDMLGTMTLSRAPFLAVALLGFLATPPALEELLKNPMILFADYGFIFMILLSIPFIVWAIVLMYRAFVITTGTKSPKSVIAFVVALFLAEFASKLIFMLLYMNKK